MSSSANPQHEPTMEEILASIRKIISEDQPEQAAKPEAPTAGPQPAAAVEAAPEAEAAAEEALPQPAESEVLDLTEELREDGTVAPVAAAPAKEAEEQDVVFQAIEEKAEAEEPAMDEDLISAATRKAVGQAFAGLDVESEQAEKPELPAPAAGTLEALFMRAVQDALTPTLQEWVESHGDDIMGRIKPLIRAWMDEHLPGLIEAAVQKEIGRAMSARKR